MMVQDLVSIIMPVYNGEKYLRDTLDSVLCQSYTNFELIIVDDRSKDNSFEIVQGYGDDNRIAGYQLEENSGGPARPRNFGIDKAQGKYIAFIDADDIWHPDKLIFQMKELKNGQYLFCSTSMINFSSAPHAFQTGSIDVREISFSKMLRKNLVPTSSVVLDKSLLSELRFNEDARYNAVEDYHLWLRIHEKIDKSVKIVSPVLLNYRENENGISRSKLKQVKKVWMVLREYRFLSGDKMGIFKRSYLFLYYAIASVYLRVYKKRL